MEALVTTAPAAAYLWLFLEAGSSPLGHASTGNLDRCSAGCDLPSAGVAYGRLAWCLRKARLRASGRRGENAPARRPQPPRPRHALPERWRTGPGARALGASDGALPRYAHGHLAG